MRTYMSRSAISAAHLYAILDREFSAAKPVGCTSCRVPLPYYREPPDEVSANWHIGTPSECPDGCDRVTSPQWW